MDNEHGRNDRARKTTTLLSAGKFCSRWRSPLCIPLPEEPYCIPTACRRASRDAMPCNAVQSNEMRASNFALSCVVSVLQLYPKKMTSKQQESFRVRK
mmetsp:Transcript_979/g.2524  ORF Transcript_979/g.2524 Transcript_979/m.2524 type:complete len:98 (+) Transcript_979:274-567(+)